LVAASIPLFILYRRYSTSLVVGAVTSGVGSFASHGANVVVGFSARGGAVTAAEKAITSVGAAAGRGMMNNAVAGITEGVMTGDLDLMNRALNPTNIMKSAALGAVASVASQAVHACDIAQVAAPEATGSLADKLTYVAAKAAIGGAAGATAAGLTQLASNVIDNTVSNDNQEAPDAQKKPFTDGLIGAVFAGAAVGGAFGAAEGVGSIAIKAVDDCDVPSIASCSELEKKTSQLKESLKELKSREFKGKPSEVLSKLGIPLVKGEDYNQETASKLLEQKLTEYKDRFTPLLKTLCSKYNISTSEQLKTLYLLGEKLNQLRESAAQLSSTMAQRFTSMQRQDNADVKVGQGVHAKVGSQQPAVTMAV
jgi:hypothetical protein